MVSDRTDGTGTASDAGADRIGQLSEHVRTHLFDDEKECREILDLFFLTVTDRLALGAAALAEGDWHELARLAHLIRGASGHVGAARLAANAGIVEMAAEAHDQAAARRHWAMLTDQFRDLCHEFRAHRQQG